MILSDKYNQIMEQIQVTDEMRQRILCSVEHACDPKNRPAFQIKRLLKKALPLTACFVFVLGLFYLPTAAKKPNLHPQVTNPILPVESLAELSDLVGFEAADISDLPFDAQTVTYTAYQHELAETKYRSEANICALRQAAGARDISGDYTNYAFQETRLVNGIAILFKGHTPELLNSAVWQHDGFSFSMTFTEGVSFDEFEKAIASIQN